MLTSLFTILLLLNDINKRIPPIKHLIKLKVDFIQFHFNITIFFVVLFSVNRTIDYR